MQRAAIGYRLLAIGCFVSGPALPAAAQRPDTTQLKDLVVTATRFPTPLRTIGSSADRLDPEELRRRQIRSLREALQLLPGGTVLVTGAPGGVTSLFLRGVSSSQTLFLLDGIRVNDADASSAGWLGGAELPGIDRVEVVRGPQSTLYGGAAIGGVVALQAAPGTGRPRGEAELDGGSFKSWRGRISGQGVSGGLGVTVALTANGTDNQRHPNDWDQRTQLIRLDYHATKRLQAGASFRGLQNSYTSPGDLRSTNTTPAGTTKFENNLGTAWVDATPLPRWQSRLLLGLGEQYSRSTVTASPALVLVGGVNREWSKVVSDGDGLRQRLWGLYGEAQLAPVGSLHLTAGVRLDDYNSFGHAVTYRLTGAWQVERATRLRASMGTGFMPPSLTARFGSGFQNPNPEIRPERARGWDAGVEQEVLAGRGTLAVTGFHNSLRDLLGFESAPFPEKGKSVNIDRARTSGLELSGRMVAGPVDARLAYTLLSARSRSEPDPMLRRLIRRPRHTASGEVVVALSSRGAVGLGVVAVADREDSDFNSFPALRVNPGDYLVARLHGSWDLGALIFQARIENLFDRRYEPVYGFPALGRSATGTVAIRF
jgi:vitamin B12 transporter